MLFEPCGDSAGAALAAVWDKNSAPVIAAPVEAPISWRKVRRVSMRASMVVGFQRRQGPEDTHTAVFTGRPLPGFQPGAHRLASPSASVSAGRSDPIVVIRRKDDLPHPPGRGRLTSRGAARSDSAAAMSVGSGT